MSSQIVRVFTASLATTLLAACALPPLPARTAVPTAEAASATGAPDATPTEVATEAPTTAPTTVPTELPTAATTPSATPEAGAPVTTPVPDTGSAADYCVAAGGTVVDRFPVYGSNLPERSQLRLSGTREFCQFLAPQAEDGSGFRSRIEIALDTLYSSEPTLAVLAYLAPPPVGKIPGSVNPATIFCERLGGTSIWGGMNNGAGGAWVTENPDAFTDGQFCMFPDLSTIDAWGLTYNANGIIRGIDLRTVLRYQPERVPHIYLRAELRETTAPGVPASSAAPSATTPAEAAGAAEAEYCQQQGGQVLTRYPTYGTTGPENEWLRLHGRKQFCEFTAKEAESDDGFRSKINIPLDVLYSEAPTLAMLAYLEPPPTTNAPPSVNPASAYCAQLGGAESFGGLDNAAGGGWVTDDENTFVKVLQACVFPDGSMLDSWGLAYNANGAIRGTDLATVARYKPERLLNVFPRGRPRTAPTQEAVMITKADNGKAITLTVDQGLVVTLDSNPTTGFTWQTAGVDGNVLQADGEPEYVPPTSQLIGAGGQQVFRFKGVESGETTLRLIYKRPFEQDVTPAPNDTFSVEVTVN